MSESVQSSGKHGWRLDDSLARHPRDDDEIPVPDLWNTPGHDGIVGEDEVDPDRIALRSEIGKYVSLARFPVSGSALANLAERADASDEVRGELGGLPGEAVFSNAHDVWQALDLTVNRRF